MKGLKEGILEKAMDKLPANNYVIARNEWGFVRITFYNKNAFVKQFGSFHELSYYVEHVK